MRVAKIQLRRRRAPSTDSPWTMSDLIHPTTRREFPIVSTSNRRTNMTRRTSSFDAGPSVETEAGSRRLQDIPTAHTTSSVALSSEVDSAPRRQFDPASTDDSSSTLESLPTPSSPRLGPAGDMDTPISSFGDLPLPWPPASDDGDATPTIQRMRAAEEQALSFARTRRFKWIAVEEGGKLVDYIVSGHQGELHRCEDEAIGAPGAVQAFGVLIAFDQEIDGRLVVQQVSEVSTIWWVSIRN